MEQDKQSIEISINTDNDRFDRLKSIFLDNGYDLRVKSGVAWTSSDGDGEKVDREDPGGLFVSINGADVHRFDYERLRDEPATLIAELDASREALREVTAIMCAAVRSFGFEAESDLRRGCIDVSMSGVLLTTVVFSEDDIGSDYKAMALQIVDSLKQNVKPRKRVFDVPGVVGKEDKHRMFKVPGSADPEEIERLRESIDEQFEVESTQGVNATVSSSLRRTDMALKKQRTLNGPKKGGGM